MFQDEKNYPELIESIKLVKKSNLLICIPTFKSFEITSDTVKSFLSQKDVDFDLMVTGPSGDIEKLSEAYSNINYCLTKDNYGSSGNQLINIYLSKKYEYEFVLLNDNDARLIGEDSLQKMFKKINEENIYVTFPDNCNGIKKNIKNFCTFHCCLYRVYFLKSFDYYFSFDYFLHMDDVAFYFKIKSYEQNFSTTNCSYQHQDFKLNSLFNYRNIFLFFRSTLIFLFREKLNNRFYSLGIQPVYTFITFLTYSFFNFDFRVIKMLAISIYQVIFKNFYLINFPEQKILYVEIFNPVNKEKFKKFSFQKDIIFPKKYICINNNDGCTQYFQLKD